jgi:hypothetical protein
MWVKPGGLYSALVSRQASPYRSDAASVIPKVMPAPRSKLLALILGAAVTATALAPLPARAAGFFEALGELFGQPARRAPAEPAAREPLSVTIGPRRAVPAHQGRQKLIASKPVQPAVKLDPATDPTWYLRDPTLRRGDIVVLKTGVIVFDGGGRGEHDSEDFTRLDQTRLLSPARRQEIAEMAAGFKAPDAKRPARPRQANRAEANAN